MVDMVFAIRQLQEKCVEQHQDLHLLFINLTKAFDTVNRAALWAILSKLGCPPRFVQIIRSFHDGMFCRVIENGDASDPFPVSNGVKQGCVLAPTLFSLLFAQMLSAALSQTEAGVKIHYRNDGDFFNLRRLKSYTKATRAIVRDFLFADDCGLAAHSEVALQELADCFATAAKIFGLTVSIRKTEVFRQLAPNTARPPPNITMDGNALKNVDTFKYLGSCINSAANLDALMKKYHGTAMVQPWYSHGATMVYHGKQWYTMVQITCTMVDYGIPWYILTVPWHILVQPWFTELVPWCIMIYHGTTLHNHSTIYL